MAGIPDLDLHKIRTYCESRLPAQHLNEWRIEFSVRGKSVTLFDARAPWSPTIGPEWTRVPIAQIRWDDTTAKWTLYWPDRNSRWHVFDLIRPGTVDKVLEEIERDQTNIFWG